MSSNDEETLPIINIDLPCRKCGSTDISHNFRRKGERLYVNLSEFDIAGRDMIWSCCRTCGYRWSSLSLDKIDKRDPIKLIDNPLEWQEMIDNQPASINMRGSARFWATVMEKLDRLIYRNGAPEFSMITIDLGDNLGLQLSTDEGRPWIDYKFVAIDKEADDF